MQLREMLSIASAATDAAMQQQQQECSEAAKTEVTGSGSVLRRNNMVNLKKCSSTKITKSMLMKYRASNERGKFCAKIFLRCTDIVIFVLGHFIATHPVERWVY